MKRRNILMILALAMLVPLWGYAQPANSTCSTATSLPKGTSGLAGTTVGTTGAEHGISGASISNYGVWYTFLGNGVETSITVVAASGYDHKIVLATGSCSDGLTQVASKDGTTGTTETLTYTTTAGVRYYVYVAHYSSTSTATATFTISRTCSSTPNITMECGVTYEGELGLTGSWSSYTSCSYSESGEEHVYVFTPTVTGSHTFTTTTTSGDPDFFLMSSNGNTGTNLTGGCWGSGNKTLDLSAGTTVYLIVDNYYDDKVSGYTVKVTCPSSITAPTITTKAVSSITYNSASSGGESITDGGASIDHKGLVWSTRSDVTLDNYNAVGYNGGYSDDGTGTSSFDHTMTGLSPGVPYYVKAYAHNSVGNGYGSAVSFTPTAAYAYTALESQSYSTGYFSGQGFNNLFDNSTSSKWCVSFSPGSTAWGIFKSAIPIKPVGYKLTTADDTYNYNVRNPKDWVLYGGNSASGPWTPIATVSNNNYMYATSGDRYQTYTFCTDDNSTAYEYFKFEVSATRGKDDHNNYILQLSEFQFLVPQYTLTIGSHTGGSLSATPSGGGEITTSGSVTPGATVTVTATPNSGYVLTALTYNDGSDHPITQTAGVYSFTMPSGNVTVSATFAPTYSINKRVYPYLDGTDYKYWKGTSSSNGSYINAGSTYAPHAAGSVSLSATTATAGSTVTITTTPKSSPSPGYKVLTVYTKPARTITTVSANSTYTFTMPSEAVTVYVVFAPNTSATTVTSSTPWTDGFDNMTWGNADPRSFTAYSNSGTLTAINDNGWALPLTVGDDGTGNNYTRYFSPRFWSSSTGSSARRLSFKCREYSEVMACLPEFSNNLNELMISFDYFMENNSGTLQVGYYNCVDGSFTSVQSWSLDVGGSYGSPAGTKTVDFGTVATTLPGSQYRIAFYMDRHATNSQSSANLFHINVKKIPHEIANIDDWNAFCAAVNAGHDYSGEEVTLTADVGTAENPITTFCGTQSVSSDNTYTAFSGTFLGGGHTLTFNLTDCQKYTAPFMTVENATIQNLRTAGSLTGSTSSDKQGKVHAGLVGVSRGTTNITGCSSTMAISSSYDDGNDVALSGIVASIRGGTLTVEGCAFKGSLTAPTPENGYTNHNGGIVGYWYTGTHVYVRNTIFAPSALNVTTGDTEYSYTIARLTHSAVVTIENCYYTMVLGTAQGKEAHTFTLAAGANGSVSHNLSAGSTYTGSGITVYSPNGIGYDLNGDGTGDIVLGRGYDYDSGTNTAHNDQVTVTATGNTGYELDQWSDGSTSSPYTYTMPANNTTLTATFKPIDYTITYNPASGSPVHGCYVSGNPTANYGETVEVTVNVATGWELTALKYNDGSDHDISISSTPYTFTMPASNVTVTATFGMLPVAVPFSDDFESGDEWVVEGSAINFWCIGTKKYHKGTHGLYITNNSSTQAYGYTIGTAAVSFAYKTIHLEEGTYIFSYDWYCVGETSGSYKYDYLRVFLAPSSATLTEASSSFTTSFTGVPSGWTAALDGGACLNQSSDWATKTVKTTIAASGDYKLVFVWRNDNSGGGNPAAIDNVEVFKVPSTIANITDWDHFAKAVNVGHTYSGDEVTMTADVGPVTTMAGISGNTFQGTFDGNCKTLSVNISTADEFAAPFHYVTNATIQDLKVTGTVLPTNGTSSRHAGGLVGSVVSTGVTINNCFVNVNVGNSSNKTDYCGGLIGHGHDGNISIIGSAYIGTLTVSGTNQVGGLVGWSDTPTGVTITNCLSECTYTNSDAGSFHPVGCANHGNNINGDNINISNCYYKYTTSGSVNIIPDDSGDKSILRNAGNKGTQAYTVTATSPATVALDGESCDGVGITTPDDPDDPGIGVGGTIYGGSGETLSLLLGTSTPVDYFTYSASTGTLSGTATEGSDDPYTLQMTANNSVITANILKNHIASTSSDTQMTWAEFATAVTGGQTYSGKTVYLDEDVNGGNNPVGTSTYPFQGTFDGGCNTLTVGITNNNQGAAPFQYIKGATIQNLTVTGSVKGGNHHAGGLVGFADNIAQNNAITSPQDIHNTIRNCRVSTNVEATGSNNYCGGIFGHAGEAQNTIEGCVFDGEIKSNGYKGAMIGWSNWSELTLINSYFCGTNSGSGTFDPVGCKTHYYAGQSTETKVDRTISNFYTTITSDFSSTNNGYCAMHSATGSGSAKRGYTLALAASPLAGGTVSHGSSTATYSCSGITAYATGIDYDGKVILGNDESATLTATANTGYTFMNWTDVTPYINNPYELTMSTANRTVTANFVDQTEVSGSGNWVVTVDESGDVPSGGFVTDGDGNVTISNEEGLAWLISNVNALNGCSGNSYENHTITLTDDVDMSAHMWVPIGTAEHPFSGTFNGNGHTITGITRSTEFPHMGLFGYTEGATIKNVIVNATLSGNSNTMGAIVGTLANSSAKTAGTVAYTEAAGSIAGGTLTTAIGGLVGSNEGGTVHSSFAVNTLTAAVNTTYVGGLVGSNSGGVQNAYSRATLGDYGLKGGLVGNNTASVENCYVVLGEQSFPAFAYHNTGDGLKYCYADKNTTYVTAGQTSPTGHGYFGVVQSSIKHLDYMYRDNAVTIVSGDANFATTGYDTDYHTPKWNGLVSALNQGRRDGQAQWYRPLTTAINGDLPVLGFPANNSMGVIGSTETVELQYGSIEDSGKGIDDLLTAYSSQTARIFLYGNATGVAQVPTDNVQVFVQEDAVLLQTTSSPNPFINTTVGVTFDNSDHGQHSYDYWGNRLDYDWHFMSTPLNRPLTGAVHGPYVASGNPYSPVDITSIGGYFPDGLITGDNPAVGGTIKWDFYSYYEPAYHWINLKRNINNHYYQDSGALIPYSEADQDLGDNKAYYIPGKGYMMAISQNTFMNASGTLNRGNVSITLTKKEPDGINYQPGANLVGNPYQGYLNLAAITDKYSGLDKFYIYDADQGVYAPVVDGSSSNPVIPSKYIHPHQGFFVLAPTDDLTLEFEPTMAGTTMGSGSDSHFRDEGQPDYPLVNLFAEDAMGHRDLTVVEFHRPELGGAEKINYLHSAPFTIAAHYDHVSYGILFASDEIDRIPVRFKTEESGTVTLTWSTYNGEFYELRLIDNKLGVDYDMLANDSYTFEASPEDYSSRFYIVYDCSGTGIDENEDDGSSTGSGSFAYIGVDGNIIIDAESYEGVSLQMIDMMGRVLYSTTVNGEMHTISTNGLAKGMYLLRLANNKNVRIQKIVVK